MSKEITRLPWVCQPITKRSKAKLLYDWLKELAQFSQPNPIVTCFEFRLVHCVVHALCHCLSWLIRFSFYDNHLQTTLFGEFPLRRKDHFNNSRRYPTRHLRQGKTSVEKLLAFLTEVSIGRHSHLRCHLVVSTSS